MLGVVIAIVVGVLFFLALVDMAGGLGGCAILASMVILPMLLFAVACESILDLSCDETYERCD